MSCNIELADENSGISNISRFKAQFQSARSLDSDIVLATASAIAASTSGDENSMKMDTSGEMQEIPQQLQDAAKLLPIVRQRGKVFTLETACTAVPI